ncbi:prolyl hydroxylase family protein [Sphingosinicella rhizophila]|uniref:2OG-Fe(II) oxygenase n=1 Tax=Sphingosinicella rhizophila TaxID=3050082 RepID=A0ABU3Q6K7_9SPHN|nr:2OG-Fe(II) oxygenase [Sphingosinicella sp. GR2756]MDT9599039.1 2OG-Fe(II) oxygenase [Sphingosinicella sp. GR2756]
MAVEPGGIVTSRGAGFVTSRIKAPPRQLSPAARRAAMSKAIRARLLMRKNIKNASRNGLEAYVVPNFLTLQDCEDLIRLIDAGREPSGLLAAHADPDFRTSESCNLHPLDEPVKRVEARLAELMGIPPAFGETIQGQRYAVGQQFKPHHDYFHTDQPYWAEQERNGGQRTWTAMAFLNTPEKGGHTKFPDAKLEIVPAVRGLLVWNNVDDKGEPNPQSLHQGLPVEAGTKYVITKWFRERPWAVGSGPVEY